MPKTYTTTLGDTWDLIAYKILGSEMHTDTLIKNNLKYRFIFLFPAGVKLIIPDIEIQPPQSLPPWKRGGAV